jgi:DNA-binding transcriptional MocR family regulator
VIVEQPTYDRPLLLLERMGVEIVPVPLSPDGVDLEAFDELLADGADFAYMIPTFQNPSGATLTLEGRRAVLASMRHHGVPVLEDDPYGLLHFEQPAPPSMLELAEGDPLLWYSSSTSKTVAPGLRVGWLVLPEVLAAEVSTIANDTYISSALLTHATLDAYFESGAFEPWIETCRSMLLDRRDRLVGALATHLPDAEFAKPAGGYFLWLKLPYGLDGREVAAAGTNLGVSLVPGASFGANCDPYVRIAFSFAPVAHLDLGVRRLAGACAAATSAATAS